MHGVSEDPTVYGGERSTRRSALNALAVAQAEGNDTLSNRLDAVTVTLGVTSRWMDQHAEFFGSISTEDEAMGGAVLPTLPEPPLTPRLPLPTPPRLRRRS